MIPHFFQIVLLINFCQSCYNTPTFRMGVDEEYPRDDESSKLDKIVRDTAG